MQTLTPLSNAIGVPIDTSVKRDKVKKLAGLISKLDPSAVALVCWEHKLLTDLAEALGVKDAPKMSGSDYDLQWTVVNGTLVSSYQGC